MGVDIREGQFFLHKLINQIPCVTCYLVRTEFYSQSWMGCLPQKFKIFVWKHSHECVDTFDKLQQKSPWLTISPSCGHLCLRNSESQIHLFSFCPYALAFWNYIQQAFGCLLLDQATYTRCSIPPLMVTLQEGKEDSSAKLYLCFLMEFMVGKEMFELSQTSSKALSPSLILLYILLSLGVNVLLPFVITV